METVEERIEEVLQHHEHISLAIIFGSRASGQATASSDLDLAVAAERALSTTEKMSLIDDLAEHFGCPIDIIDLMAVSGPIMQQALCKGRILIKKRPSLYAKLMLRMWYNQADVMPYYNRTLKKRVEAFAHG